MDLGSIMKLKNAWGVFSKNHPKFPNFLNAIKQRGLLEGDIIEISIKGADGKDMKTNIKVQASDLELFENIKNIGL